MPAFRKVWLLVVLLSLILLTMYFRLNGDTSEHLQDAGGWDSRWTLLRQRSPPPPPRLPSPPPPPHLPPPAGPCTCSPGSVLLKDLLPEGQYEVLSRRRAKELQQHKNRTTSVLSTLLYALPNSPLQYPIQGYTVRPLTPSLIPGAGTQRLSIQSNSLVILNELLSKVSYTSSFYHINSGDLASFRFERHGAVFPIAIRQPRLPVLYDMGADVRSQVTVTTKTFLRYNQLKTLLDSIRRFYPDVGVVIADDSLEPEKISRENVRQFFMPPAEGWFAGRNLVVSQVTTKYMLWVDDDFLFTEKTKIEKFVEVMEENPELDVVGGAVKGNQFHFSLLYEEGENTEGGCLYRKSGGKFHPLPGYPQCFLTQGVVNFFLARTDAVRRVGFDPQLRRVAHSEFFMDGLGSLMVATCGDVTIDHQPKTAQNHDPVYDKFRNPQKSDDNLKLQLHYFKNHLKCIRYG